MSHPPANRDHVTEQQRDRAVDYLQQAYAQGSIDADAFEDRLAQALGAETRRDLNLSLRGIARVASPEAPSRTLAPAPVALPQVADNVQNVGAGLVHLLGLPTGFVGPAIVKAITPKGSRLWWEAGRAMAWQFTAMLLMVATVTVGLVFDAEVLIALGGLAWLLATVTFAVRAFNGADSTGVVGRVFPFRPQLPR